MPSALAPSRPPRLCVDCEQDAAAEPEALGSAARQGQESLLPPQFEGLNDEDVAAEIGERLRERFWSLCHPSGLYPDYALRSIGPSAASPSGPRPTPLDLAHPVVREAAAALGIFIR
jgi:hypothetical protein